MHKHFFAFRFLLTGSILLAFSNNDLDAMQTGSGDQQIAAAIGEALGKEIFKYAFPGNANQMHGYQQINPSCAPEQTSFNWLNPDYAIPIIPNPDHQSFSWLQQAPPFPPTQPSLQQNPLTQTTTANTASTTQWQKQQNPKNDSVVSTKRKAQNDVSSLSPTKKIRSTQTSTTVDPIGFEGDPFTFRDGKSIAADILLLRESAEEYRADAEVNPQSRAMYCALTGINALANLCNQAGKNESATTLVEAASQLAEFSQKSERTLELLLRCIAQGASNDRSSTKKMTDHFMFDPLKMTLTITSELTAALTQITYLLVKAQMLAMQDPEEYFRESIDAQAEEMTAGEIAGRAVAFFSECLLLFAAPGGIKNFGLSGAHAVHDMAVLANLSRNLSQLVRAETQAAFAQTNIPDHLRQFFAPMSTCFVDAFEIAKISTQYGKDITLNALGTIMRNKKIIEKEKTLGGAVQKLLQTKQKTGNV